ncbi:MAG TPA: DUF655 domain-containing protein [Leptolyngbyaceae cyanobacterium]
MKKAVLTLLASILVACQQAKTQINRPTPLPQDPFVEVYFNHDRSSEYVEPYRRQRRSGDDLEQVIVDTINTAQSTVDVAVQELRLPKIAKALAEKKKAGVKVRVILENSYSRPWSKLTSDEIAKLPEREKGRYQEFIKLVDQNRDNQLSAEEIDRGDAIVILQKADIPIIDDTADGSKGSGLMHHKFVIIDRNTLIITSANLTTSDTHGDFNHLSSLGNANNLLKIESSQLAYLFTEEFNIMWGDGPNGQPDSKFGIQKPLRPAQQIIEGNNNIEVQFSPTSPTKPWEESSNGLIGKTLNLASRSVNIALFVFSEQRLVNMLENHHQKGVQIRALIDPDFAYRPYSEALDMMGVALPNNCKYEPDNRPWQDPISTVGIPQLLKGDLLHHKFGVVDSKIVITGSHNWSVAANANNDETVLVIQNPTVAAHFDREFERLYSNAILGLPERIKQKIQAQQKQCPVTSILPTTVSIKNKLEFKTPPQPNIDNLGGQKININTASQQELESLPGVGPKLAQEIIKARQQKPFTSLEDLDNVPGVGPSLLEKLKERVTW